MSDINTPPIDESKLFEEECSFILTRIGTNNGCREILARNFNRTHPMIDAMLTLIRSNFYHIDMDIVTNNIVKYIPNKYALAFMFHIKYHCHFKEASEYALKALDAGCVEMWPVITNSFLQLFPSMTFDQQIADRCTGAECINRDELIKFTNKLDPKEIKKFLLRVGNYDKYEYHVFLFQILQSKNNTIDQLKQQLQEQKDKHEAEIKELLVPGNLGAKAAESRFKASASVVATDKTSADIKGLDE